MPLLRLLLVLCRPRIGLTAGALAPNVHIESLHSDVLFRRPSA
jgi:hypothetical protein